MRSFNPELQKQRGVAIITAMLVVALGTITMVAITARQQFDLQREQNEAVIQQARALAISGERFAAAVLFRDKEAADRENSDSLDDDWATTIPPIPIDDRAVLQGCIVDMQGRFNLNNLVDSEGKAVDIYFEQLKRLFSELGIDAVKAQAVVDWVDINIDATVPDGAEDDYYSGLEPAYRAANAPFVSVSELQLVKGFSSAIKEERDDYELLIPHISALPTANGATKINVNTATPEVIASMSEFLKPLASDLSRWDTSAYADYPACEDIFDLEAEEAPETLEDERDLSPYESTLLFEDEAAPESGEEVAPPGTYDVKSRYYQLRIDVVSENLSITQYSLFEREDNGKTRIIYRARDAL